MNPPSAPLDPCLIRLFGPRQAVGAGFLVAPRLAATCAHVIASALGLKDIPARAPDSPVALDFPLLRAGARLSGRVVAWQPPQEDGGGDIALLELDGDLPAEAQPAALVQADDLWGHAFRAFGFPPGYENGAWSDGRITHRQADGWLQIESTNLVVQPGYSGGPAWDSDLGGVVGLITAARDARTG